MTDAAAVAEDFNPRSPHGERPRLHRRECRLLLISIHAPRTGSDATYFAMQIASDVFQSTLPARGATPPDTIIIAQGIYISIHAPRTGSDIRNRAVNRMVADFNPRSPHGERPDNQRWQEDVRYFNPRSPHGERLRTVAIPSGHFLFQSTLPARGATKRTIFKCRTLSISIHAPRTGSDATD